jgi:hypothetical protein
LAFTLGVSPVFNDSSTATNVLTLTGCTAGQTVIIGYMTEPTTVSGITCPGETVNLRGTQLSGFWQMQMADCTLSSGGSKTFTLGLSGTPTSQFWAFQVLGGPATYDTSVGNSSTSGANISIGITTGGANALVVGQLLNLGGSASAAGGYTSMGLDDIIQFDQAEYNLNVGAAGAQTVGFTNASSGSGAMIQAYSWLPPSGGVIVPNILGIASSEW